MEKKSIFSYVKVGLILALIAAVCGISIALLNSFTSPIIEENAYKKEQETLQLIYQGATFEKIDFETSDKNIKKVYKAIILEEVVGYVYVVSGKNAYGTIELMIGINEGSVSRVEMTTNTQSFGKLVDNYVTGLSQKEITSANVSSLDVKCGATYGAKLVRSLIESALKHSSGGEDNE